MRPAGQPVEACELHNLKMVRFHFDGPFNFVLQLQHKVEAGVQGAHGEQNLIVAVLRRKNN